SLMTLYWYRDAWHIASSGIPDAAGGAHGGSLTFAELFRRTWAALGYRWPDADGGRLCFMFELRTPENRGIGSHESPRIVLHGVRDLGTMQELEPEPIAASHGWECVRTLPLTCGAECLAAAAELHPARAEGYVVRDGAFGRVKVK